MNKVTPFTIKHIKLISIKQPNGLNSSMRLDNTTNSIYWLWRYVWTNDIRKIDQEIGQMDKEDIAWTNMANGIDDEGEWW